MKQINELMGINVQICKCFLEKVGGAPKLLLQGGAPDSFSGSGQLEVVKQRRWSKILRNKLAQIAPLKCTRFYSDNVRTSEHSMDKLSSNVQLVKLETSSSASPHLQFCQRIRDCEKNV